MTDWIQDNEDMASLEETENPGPLPGNGEDGSPDRPIVEDMRQDIVSALMDLQEENRKQIRAFRKFIENYASLSDRIENSLHNIYETVANMRRQDADSLLRSVREETARDIYKTLLDVRDSLVRGVKKTRFHLDKMSALRKMAAGAPLLKSLIEGQEVALQRLDDCLRHTRIMELDAKGKAFDPHTMCVTATLETDAVPEGTVVEILRPGYMMGDAVLRCAEVRVARPPRPPEKEHLQ